MAIKATIISKKPAKYRTGIYIRIDITDGNRVFCKNIYFHSVPAPAEINNKITSILERIRYKLNPLNEIEIEGIELKPLIKQMVKYIRKNPGVTRDQLATAVDTAYPDLDWKPDRLINKLREIVGKTITFDQFKTFCIDHRFGGVDG